MRWDYVTDYSSTLSNDILDFSVNSSGKKIALLKSTNMTANGVELFNLAILDFDTKQITNLIENSTSLEMITISPNGEWIAYARDSFKRSIYAIPSDGSQKEIELGVCNQESLTTCEHGLAWSPNSQSLLWSDDQGVWMASIPDNQTKKILSNQIVVKDPKDEEQQIHVEFGSHLWSPDSRFVLLQVIPSTSGVHWLAVLDTRSGRLHQVPDAYNYFEEYACAIWTANNTLLVAHSGDAEEGLNPYINLWEIIPTHDDLLLPLETYELNPTLLSTSPETAEIMANHYPDWLSQTDDGALRFGMKLHNKEDFPILYHFDPANGSLDEMIVIPYQTFNILWAPDGVGALVLGKDGEIIFAPFDGSLMRELHLELGQDANHFIWLPPTPRS